MDRLRGAAGEQHRISRMVRVGTVNAATVPLLIPTVRELRAAHPLTQVEVVAAQQTEIHRALSEGGLDLGLVNHLDGDDLPADFETTELPRGRPVVCLRPDSPLAALAAVSAADLLDGREALIARRSEYVMHRGAITHRPLTDDTTRVLLMLRRRRAESVPRAAHDLHEAFVRRAAELGVRLSDRP